MSGLNACSAYTAGFLWSSTGLGQVVGLPIALIAAVSGVVLKCLSCCVKSNTAETFNRKAISCFVVTLGLAIAAIPVVGGMIMVYMIRNEGKQRNRATYEGLET